MFASCSFNSFFRLLSINISKMFFFSIFPWFFQNYFICLPPVADLSFFTFDQIESAFFHPYLLMFFSRSIVKFVNSYLIGVISFRLFQLPKKVSLVVAVSLIVLLASFSFKVLYFCSDSIGIYLLYF